MPAQIFQLLRRETTSRLNARCRHRQDACATSLAARLPQSDVAGFEIELGFGGGAEDFRAGAVELANRSFVPGGTGDRERGLVVPALKALGYCRGAIMVVAIPGRAIVTRTNGGHGANGMSRGDWPECRRGASAREFQRPLRGEWAPAFVCRK